MKYIFIALLITFAFSPARAQSHDHQAHDHAGETLPALNAGTVDPNGQLIQVEALGLVCDFCARALEKVFMKRAEVSGINVDLNQKIIVIALKEGASMDDETVARLITDAGYNVAGMTRKPAGGAR